MVEAGLGGGWEVEEDGGEGQLAGSVGVICGTLGLLFYLATDVGTHLVLKTLIGYQPALPAGEVNFFNASETGAFTWWWLLIALVVGGLISGLIALRAPEVQGAGSDPTIDAFHRARGRMPLRSSLMKFAASVVTLSSGGSAGREGPIAMVGAGMSSWFGQRLKLSSRDCRILLAAGMAGGIAAIFRAPLAGALFAAEVLYADSEVESDVLIPSFISAIVAFCTFGLLEGSVFPGSTGGFSLFKISDGLDFSAGDAAHLVGYLLLALSLVVSVRAFTNVAFWTERAFKASPLPIWIRPALGGLITGLIALSILNLSWWTGVTEQGSHITLATLGSGYGILQQIMDGALGSSAMLLLLLIAAGKLLTSCATVASGGSGGLFGPSLVIGGCVGGAIGFALEGLTIAPPIEACVIMGMAGTLAATYKTPIAALLMVSEMTGAYSLLIPSMWVCALAFLLSGRRGILRSQVPNPVDSPAHRGHFFNDILAGIRVAKVFDPERPVRTLRPDSSIDECKHLVTETHQNVYPLVDDEGHLRGIFNLNDLRGFLYDDSLGLVAVAQDVATTDIITLRPRDSLASALRRFTIKNLEELPVVDNDDPTRFLGLLTRREIIAYYNRVVDELRQQRIEDGWEPVDLIDGTGKADLTPADNPQIDARSGTRRG